MSETDSFINEVTEEVRRDQLYGYLRRYGWIAVVLVLVLVGGAGWNEYRKSQQAASAEARGDALLAALEANDPQERSAALAAVTVDGPAAAVSGLIHAASQQDAGDIAGAFETLNALAVNPDVPADYRDLAALKAAMLDTGDTATRRQTLDALAQPGGTFYLLALEQLAYLDLAADDQAGAIAKMTQIIEDAGVSRGLRERAQTLMVALGQELAPPATDN